MVHLWIKFLTFLIYWHAARALELFLQDLIDRTYEITLQSGAKTLNSFHLWVLYNWHFDLYHFFLSKAHDTLIYIWKFSLHCIVLVSCSWIIKASNCSVWTSMYDIVIIFWHLYFTLYKHSCCRSKFSVNYNAYATDEGYGYLLLLLRPRFYPVWCHPHKVLDSLSRIVIYAHNSFLIHASAHFKQSIFPLVDTLKYRYCL